MTGNGPHRNAYLALDQLATNPSLARRLPVDVARRFHALPLAEDRGRVTVAMADPDDTAAREAIESIMGASLYVVQAAPGTIDSVLVEIWGDETGHPLGLGVCEALHPVAVGVWDYAQSLAGLLGAHLSRLDIPETADDLAQQGEVAAHDLVVLGEANLPLIHRMLSASTKRGVAVEQNRMASAIVVAQQPRWPLKHVLLILCGEESDGVAVEWVLRLARPGGAAVTVLALVPPVPDVVDPRTGMERGLPGLLSSDTRLGRQMQAVARHLVNSEIESILRLRQGPPDWQICRELVEGDYDLIVAGQLCQWWQQWLDTELLDSLLRWTDRPVLVATPVTAYENR